MQQPPIDSLPSNVQVHDKMPFPTLVTHSYNVHMYYAHNMATVTTDITFSNHLLFLKNIYKYFTTLHDGQEVNKPDLAHADYNHPAPLRVKTPAHIIQKVNHITLSYPFYLHQPHSMLILFFFFL